MNGESADGRDEMRIAVRSAICAVRRKPLALRIDGA
jgi:hypothetical protein